jgi:hypothetical protein
VQKCRLLGAVAVQVRVGLPLVTGCLGEISLHIEDGGTVLRETSAHVYEAASKNTPHSRLSDGLESHAFTRLQSHSSRMHNFASRDCAVGIETAYGLGG